MHKTTKTRFLTWGNLAFCRYCIFDGQVRYVRSVLWHATLVACAVDPSEHLKTSFKATALLMGNTPYVYQPFQTISKDS